MYRKRGGEKRKRERERGRDRETQIVLFAPLTDANPDQHSLYIPYFWLSRDKCDLFLIYFNNDDNCVLTGDYWQNCCY